MGLDKELTKEEKKWLDDLWSLDEAPESIRFDKYFMLQALKEDGSCLEYTSEELKNDKEIALLAVQNSRSALEHISINLKNDKEVVLVALQNGNSLEFASDELKCDASLAISLIKSANEKNKTDIFSNDLDMGRGIEHFDASVFGNEELVNELVSVTLIPFLNLFANNYGMDNNIYNVIKIHKEKLEGAIKKDFEVRLEKAKEIINSDHDFDDKLTKCFSGIFRYYFTNAVDCFDIDYNLVENSYKQDCKMLLSQKLFEIVTVEVIEELENQACNFNDINNLISNVSVESYTICCDHGYDNPRTEGKAAELFNKLPNYASEEDVSTIIYCIRSSSEWDVTEDCTDAFESIMAIIEEKITDKSIVDKLTLFDDIGQTHPYSFFSSDFKSALLESINKMDEAEKEDLYDLDEIVEYLKE